MLRRLLIAFVMVVLVAPAIATCAGTTSAQSSARHDCCPKEETTASIAESCCRMSDAAGQRVPSPTSQTLSAAAPTTVPMPARFNIVSSNSPALPVRTAPVSVDHVPRHLLLSVLIV